jgi:L-asparaginase type II
MSARNVWRHPQPRRSRTIGLLGALAATFCGAASGRIGAQRTPLPRVHVLATGGTIGATGAYYAGRPTRLTADELVQAVPAIARVAAVTAEQFSNVPSGSIGPPQWLALSRRIGDVFRADPGLAGIVVTHGTDTMEETAYFLDLTVSDSRPVVVTGAMRPADAVGADGPANLYNAVRVAAAPVAKSRGALVLMNDKIFGARAVTKLNTTRVDAFHAPDYGPLGVADPDTLVFEAPPPAVRHPVFDLRGVSELPRVDIVYAYGGVDSVAVDALVAAGARGIVVASVGRGSIPPALGAALRKATARNIAIVVSSRTGSGRVPIANDENTIGTGDLNPQKARVLLTLALTRTNDRRELARIFELGR